MHPRPEKQDAPLRTDTLGDQFEDLVDLQIHGHGAGAYSYPSGRGMPAAGERSYPIFLRSTTNTSVSFGPIGGGPPDGP